MNAKALRFEGVHIRTVRNGSIGFPDLFYHVIKDTGKVALTQARGGLFGYRPGNWKTLKHSLDSLHISKEDKTALIKAFVDKAIICHVNVDPYLMDETGKIARGIIVLEQNRLEVPQEMIEQAELDQWAVLIGMGHFFAIWPPIFWLKSNNRF